MPRRSLTAREQLDREMPERALQELILQAARFDGWRRHHQRPSPTGRPGKWVSAIQGDRGFPDLILARRGRLVVAELKRELGRLDQDQQAWLDLFGQVPGIEVFVWRPRHWSSGEILAVLK